MNDDKKPTILFLDAHFVAIHKPAGLMVHRSALARPRRLALQWVRDTLGQRVFPVHRLDRATSGILLFALDSQAAAQMQSAFRQRQVHKTYLAVVRGFVPEQGRIQKPIQDGEGEAKSAVTDFKLLEHLSLPVPVGQFAEARYSLVQLTPHDGRRHQLRKHMAHLRHPIVGDTAHGDGKHNRLFRDHLAIHRLMLAATELRFQHPYTHEAIVIRWQPEPIFTLDSLRTRFEDDAPVAVQAWD